MRVTCRVCKRTFTLAVTQEQLGRWKSGEKIQNVMPHLSADQRELLISGTCGECFDQMFKD